MDEDAASFFQNLEEHADELDNGAADFFANLGDVASPEASQSRLPETSSNALAVPGSYIEEETSNKSKFTSPVNNSQHVETTSFRPQQKAKPNNTKRRELREREGPTLPMDERIVNLLVPEMRVSEIVQLIKKLKQAGKSESDEFSSQDVRSKTAPRFICDVCGNIEQNNFVTDYARGDTICKGKDGFGCGNVVQDHIVHEGSAYRKFEGEEDKSHHGPAPNRNFSTGHNLRTLISTDGVTSGSLRRAADFVEMNISQMNKDDRRTRIGYKDQMKKKAFSIIDNAASNLDLHELVVERSKMLFSQFRDFREHVHKSEAVIAGCILSSYLEVQKEMLDKPMAEEKELFPFHCQWCGLKFNAKRALQFHNCDRKPAEPKDNGRRTKNREVKQLNVDEERYQPIIEKINGKTWFKCSICNRKYEQQDKFKEHVKRHVNQSKRRKFNIENEDVDSTRHAKTSTLSSANPSVQVNTHEEVLFRGMGRRPWIQKLKEETNQ